MKRTPLKRTKSLKSSSGPAKRGKRVKRAVWWLKDLFSYRDGVRREVEREAHVKVWGGGKSAWIRSRECVVPTFSPAGVYEARGNRCVGKLEAAHIRSRGAGGDATDLVPLCHKHHSQSHTIGIQTFERRYQIDLTACAATYEYLWQITASRNGF
jgi:hypothetical protein